MGAKPVPGPSGLIGLSCSIVACSPFMPNRRGHAKVVETRRLPNDTLGPPAIIAISAAASNSFMSCDLVRARCIALASGHQILHAARPGSWRRGAVSLAFADISFSWSSGVLAEHRHARRLFEFEAVERRSVVASFDGGNITSNAGALLLGQVDRGLGLVRRFADCFVDRRDPRYVEHQVDAVGTAHLRPGIGSGERARSIAWSTRRGGMRRSITRSIATERRSMRCWSISSLMRMIVRRARSYWISTTPTSRCTASRRDGFTTDTIKSTATCRSTCSAVGTCCWRASGVRTSRAVMERSRRWRASLPRSADAGRAMRIILRGDSGFCNDELMGWCEANRVDYVFGLARNRRLEAALVNQLAEAKRLCAASGRPARVFRDFQYCTIDSQTRTRRVVGKAEHTLEGANLLHRPPRSGVAASPTTRVPSMSSSTAPAARRTHLASSSSCSPITRLVGHHAG